MGATLEYVKYDGHDYKKNQKEFHADVRDTENDIVSDYMWENDCGREDVDYECLMYTGSIYELGSLNKLYPKIVDSEEEAVEILANEHQKWSSAWMIRIKDGTSLVGGWCSC